MSGARWDCDPETRFVAKETGLPREIVARISEACGTLAMDIGRDQIDFPSKQELMSYIANKTGIAEADVARVIQAMERFIAPGWPKLKLKDEPS
jgi:hypothetical protein